MKKQLSKSDIQRINKEIEELGRENFFSKKDPVELWDEEIKFIVKQKERLFFYHESLIFPTLKLLLNENFLKTVVVDMGAIKFVTNGADIMRPGIVNCDKDIKKDEVVVVVDETHKKPLAVCQALFSGEELLQLKEGRVLKNLHWIGDKIWNL